MEKTGIWSKIKKWLPGAALLAVLGLLIGLSFLPGVRGEKTHAADMPAELDGEALRVLECAKAHAAGEDFCTELSGKIKARVLGVLYTQSLHGEREVHGADFCERAESVSALVKAGVQKIGLGGKLYAADGRYGKRRFSFGEPTELSREQYIAGYGKPSVGLVKYELDGNIISAEAVGPDTYRYVLDAARATEFCRNEVKRTVGCKSYPKYSHVEFTVTVSGERAIKTVCREEFTIDKFGGTKCVAEYTENFVYNNNKDKDDAE